MSWRLVEVWRGEIATLNIATVGNAFQLKKVNHLYDLKLEISMGQLAPAGRCCKYCTIWLQKSSFLWQPFKRGCFIYLFILYLINFILSTYSHVQTFFVDNIFNVFVETVIYNFFLM